MKNCKIIIVENFVKEEQPGFKILKIGNPGLCRIVERLNRFVVKVEVGGDYYRAHLNNTGKLSEFLIKGRKAFCFSDKNPPYEKNLSKQDIIRYFSQYFDILFIKDSAHKGPPSGQRRYLYASLMEKKN
jgi:hypothetical protein